MKDILDFLQDNYGISSNTIITVITTLCIFIIGFVLQGVKRSITAYYKRKSYRKLFTTLITSIAEDCEKQAENFAVFANSLFMEVEREDFANWKKHAIGQLDNINKLSVQVFFESYFTGVEQWFGKRIKEADFNNIYNIISQLNLKEKESYKAYVRLDKKINQHLAESDKYVDRVLRIIYEDIYDRERKWRNDYLKRIEKIRDDWENESDKIIVVKKVLIDPLIELCESNDDNQIRRLLYNELLGADNAYDCLKMLLDRYKKGFHTYSNKYKSTADELRSLVGVSSKK